LSSVLLLRQHLEMQRDCSRRVFVENLGGDEVMTVLLLPRASDQTDGDSHVYVRMKMCVCAPGDAARYQADQLEGAAEAAKKDGNLCFAADDFQEAACEWPKP